MDLKRQFRFSVTESQLAGIQRRFLRYFRPGTAVLDAGCGRGEFLELLTKAGIRATGCDDSEEAISRCREKGLTDVFQADVLEYLRRTAKAFDGIFCSHVIEHMEVARAREFLRLVCAALRPGGVLVIVTPNFGSLDVATEIFWLDPTHVRPYPAPLLAAMCEDAGFTVRDQRRFQGTYPGRRKLPRYFLLRLLLGEHYGKANLFLVCEKSAEGTGS